MNAPTTVIGEAVQALRRVVIEGVEPQVDGGRFPIKRTIGEKVQVRADIYADGTTFCARRCCTGPPVKAHGSKRKCGWWRMTGGRESSK